MKYDVIVIGAGPIGSTVARFLAEEGFNVCIYEKKKQVGLPLQCAGLVSRKISKLNPLPENVIINKVRKARAYSPSNISINVSKEDYVGYVIDRVKYDQYLLNKAIENGVDVFLGHKVEKINHDDAKVYVKNKIVKAKFVVDASGYNSKAVSKLIPAIQYLVEIDNIEKDCVEIHLFSKLLPGFAWMIPLSKKLARIGLLSGNKKDLYRIMDKYKVKGVLEKYRGFVPAPEFKKIYNGRTILIGDAASQVKPTTYGGLILGFSAAKIATEVLKEAIEENNPKILKKYHEEYYKKYGKELRIQLLIKKILSLMNDKQLDYLFRKIKENNIEELLSKYGDMDKYSKLFKEVIKKNLSLLIPESVWQRTWNFF